MSSNLSRRSFLKGAAALAVVSAASGVLAGCSAADSTSGVTGSGAVRVFKDGENIITITSTSIDTISVAGDRMMKVVPSFKVENKTKSALYFKASVDGITDYTMVVSACFDGKLPEAEPVKATIMDTSYQEMPIIGADLKDFTQDAAGANDITEGALVFDAPFKNWEQMVVTMTLYKKAEDGPAEIGTAAYTFEQ